MPASPNLLARIANPDIGDPTSFARGAGAGNALWQMNNARQANAFAPGAISGDKNALAALAGVDPNLAMTIDNRNYERGRQGVADSRANAAESRRLAAEKTDHVASVLYGADTPEKFTAATAHLQQLGIDTSKLTFDQRESYINDAMSLSDKIKQGVDLAKIAADAGKPVSEAGKTAYDQQRGLIVPPAALPGVQVDPQGRVDPASQEAFLAALDPATANLIKQIANYQMDISKVTSLRGGEREKIAGLVSSYDPSFNMQQYAARASLTKDLASGKIGAGITSMNKVIGHIAELTKAAEELHNTKIPLLNIPMNAGRRAAGGDAAITNFLTDASAVATEMDKAMKGTGAADVAGIQDWRRNVSENMSPEQIKGSTAEMVKLLSSQIAAVRDQYIRTMGRPPPTSFLSQKSRKILTDLGFDPNAIEGADNAPGPGSVTGGGDGYTVEEIQ